MTNETNDEQNTAPSDPTYPLAHDVNGVPLTIPVEAVAWRVRKLAKRAGRPKLIIDAETGAPLELPLGATYDDLCDHVAEPGRYRLEAVDGRGVPIANCVAVTEVFSDDGEDDSANAAPQLSGDVLPVAMQLIAQLVQSNAKVMEAMASAFGQVQPTAAPAPIVVAPATATQEKPQMNPIEMFQAAMQMMSAMKPNNAPNGTGATPGADGAKA